MKREQLSDDGLKRIVWHFIARDQKVTLASVAIEAKPSKRHRKWVTKARWDSWLRGHIPVMPPQDVVDSVLDEVRASVAYVEPRETREW